MNNLNDYYNYLNNYNDMNFMTNPNTMITDMNYQNMFPNNYTIPNTNTNSSITDSQIGFKRGNLFNNLSGTELPPLSTIIPFIFESPLLMYSSTVTK